MKENRSRYLLIASLVVLVLAALILITGGNFDENSGEPKTTLRVALWDYDVVDYDRKIVEAFEKTHPDIKIEVINYSASYYNKSVKTLIDSGEKVDVIYVNQLSQLNQIAASDKVLPLGEYIERDGVDLSNYPQLDVLELDSGELYALPYRKDKFLLYYNKDLFREAGMESPEGLTWEGLTETAQALKEELSGEETPLCLLLVSSFFNYMLGGESTDTKTLAAATFQSQISYLLDLQEKGLCIPFATADNIQMSQQMFETGNYAMYIQGTWYMNMLKTDQEQGNFSFDWGAAEKPVWYEGAEENNHLWLTPVCINKNSTEPEAAWEFVKFVCGEEGARILADELVVPAYQDEEIRALLEENLRSYGIDPAIVLDGYGEAADLLTPEEEAEKEVFEEYYKKALLQLCTVEEAQETIKSALSS